MNRVGETIRAEGLRVEVGNVTLLEDVSLELPAGALTVIMGPNGAGKTTLIRAIGGLDQPTTGQIRWGGSALDELEPLERARRVAHVGHEASPPFPWTVLELVLMGRAPHLGLRGLEREEDRRLALSALEAVELQALAERRVDSLSAGETQRLMWARALCQQTPILMLDEPISHQDPRHALRLMERLRAHTSSGHTVVTVLHDVSLALRYADHVVLLCDGRVRSSGPSSEVTLELLTEIYGAPCRREGDHLVFDPPPDAETTL